MLPVKSGNQNHVSQKTQCNDMKLFSITTIKDNHKLQNTSLNTTEVNECTQSSMKWRKYLNKTDFGKFLKVFKFSGECQALIEWVASLTHCGKLTQMTLTAELQLHTNHTRS